MKKTLIHIGNNIINLDSVVYIKTSRCNENSPLKSGESKNGIIIHFINKTELFISDNQPEILLETIF